MAFYFGSAPNRPTSAARDPLAAARNRNTLATLNQTMVAPTQVAPSYNANSVAQNVQSFNERTSNLGNTRWQDIASRSVSAPAAAAESMRFNLDNLDTYKNLARTLTEGDMNVKMEMLDRISPGWSATARKAEEMNLAMVSGELPKDVQDKISRSAAFKSMTGGSANANSVMAQDLGLTSLEVSNQGQKNAMDFTQLMNSLLPQQTTGAGVMAAQGLSPEQTLQAALANAGNSLQADSANSAGRASAEQFNETTRSSNLWMATDALNQNEVNRYGAEMNSSNINFGNSNRPFQSYREDLGWAQGQQSRTSFGIRG